MSIIFSLPSRNEKNSNFFLRQYSCIYHENTVLKLNCEIFIVFSDDFKAHILDYLEVFIDIHHRIYFLLNEYQDTI